MKNSSAKCWLCFRLFVAGTKISFGYSFVALLIIEIPLLTLHKAVSICVLKFNFSSRYIPRCFWCEALSTGVSLKTYLDEESHLFSLRRLDLVQL